MTIRPHFIHGSSDNHRAYITIAHFSHIYIAYDKYCDMTPESRNSVAKADVHCWATVSTFPQQRIDTELTHVAGPRHSSSG
jgi:hypothetical protein